MHCGTFCWNTFLIKDEAIRDAFHRLNTGDIGGEMEGGELLKLQQDGKVEGVIVIKGVADFADKDKAKHWQYTAAKAALHYIKVQLRNTDEFEVFGECTLRNDAYYYNSVCRHLHKQEVDLVRVLVYY